MASKTLTRVINILFPFFKACDENKKLNLEKNKLITHFLVLVGERQKAHNTRTSSIDPFRKETYGYEILFI